MCVRIVVGTDNRGGRCRGRRIGRRWGWMRIRRRVIRCWCWLVGRSIGRWRGRSTTPRGAMSRLDVAGTVSKAVDALTGAKEDTVGEIRKAHARYVAAGEALVGYASALERVQAETLAALGRARDAQDQVQAASGSKDRWQELADGAKDPVDKQEYAHKASHAGVQAAQAQGLVSGARSTIESAVSDRDRAAGAAMDRIEEITSSDDLNDSWWDNWGSKLVAAIADIADMISTIARSEERRVGNDCRTERWRYAGRAVVQ